MKAPLAAKLFTGLIFALAAHGCSDATDEPATSNPTSSSTSVIATAQSAQEHGAAMQAGTMPDLRGWDLNELGDGGGVLYPLQDLIGIQDTKWIASDEIAAGSVVAQSPDPGSSLDDIGTWALEVSDGGPRVPFALIPAEFAALARTLPGFDVTEDLIERTTSYGNVYKSDSWLFGLDCRAVESTYRTFFDGRYETACSGDGRVEPSG